MSNHIAEAVSPSPASPARRGQGWAVTALVTGIIGLVSCLTAPVAITCGIIALVKGQSKGMSITGIVTGVLGLIIAPALIFPAIVMVRQLAYEAQDGNNMRHIASAIHDHAQQHDGVAPTWDEVVATLTAAGEQRVLSSRTDPSEAQPYLYIRPAAGAPGQQVLMLRNPALQHRKNLLLITHVDGTSGHVAMAVWPVALALAASATAAGPGVASADMAAAGLEGLSADSSESPQHQP